MNSLADGMNLVAYAELDAGIGVEPRDVDPTASAFERALEMGEAERRRRAAIANGAVRRWAARHWPDAELADLDEAACAAGVCPAAV